MIGGRITLNFDLESENDKIEFAAFGIGPHTYSREYGHTPANEKGCGSAYLSREPARRPTLARAIGGVLVESQRRGVSPNQSSPEFNSTT